jgi:hypothetical protein
VVEGEEDSEVVPAAMTEAAQSATMSKLFMLKLSGREGQKDDID